MIVDLDEADNIKHESGLKLKEGKVTASGVFFRGRLVFVLFPGSKVISSRPVKVRQIEIKVL